MHTGKQFETFEAAPESSQPPGNAGTVSKAGRSGSSARPFISAASPLPTQQPLPTTGQRRGKPLLPVRGVCSLVDLDENRTLALIEEGKIAWAWNFATERARAKELRVLPAAVADYMRGQACSLKWPDVLALVVPHGGTEFTSTEITRALNVSGEHFYNLVRAKVLAPCSGWCRGPRGHARVLRKTLVSFLESRRWP